MAFTQKLSYQLILSEPGGAQETFNWTNSDTTTGVLSISEDVLDSTTDALVAAVIDVSQIKSIVIWADRIMTVETNTTPTGVDVFVLAANVPIFWDNSLTNITNPWTTDVTALYLTNTSGGTVQFELRCLFDSTL